MKAGSKSRNEEERKFLLDPPEVAVFMACCIMVNELRGLERSLKVGELTQALFLERANELLTKLGRAAAGTERFDLVIPVLGHGQFSPFFWRWFNWWEDYFVALSPTEIGEIERLGRELRFEVNAFRPTSHWATYRHTPAFTLPER